MTSFKIIGCSALLAFAPFAASASGVEVLSTQAAGAVAGSGAGAGAGAAGAGAAGAGAAGAAAAAGLGVGTLSTVVLVGSVAVAGVIGAAIASAVEEDAPSGTPSSN